MDVGYECQCEYACRASLLRLQGSFGSSNLVNWSWRSRSMLNSVGSTWLSIAMSISSLVLVTRGADWAVLCVTLRSEWEVAKVGVSRTTTSGSSHGMTIRVAWTGLVSPSWRSRIRRVVGSHWVARPIVHGPLMLGLVEWWAVSSIGIKSTICRRHLSNRRWLLNTTEASSNWGLIACSTRRSQSSRSSVLSTNTAVLSSLRVLLGNSQSLS